MKEANPVSIRFGTSMLWTLISAPLFYSEQYRNTALLNKFLFKILGGNKYYYTIFRPTVIQSSSKCLLIHFYYYATQLTFRTYIGKFRARRNYKIRYPTRLARKSYQTGANDRIIAHRIKLNQYYPTWANKIRVQIKLAYKRLCCINFRRRYLRIVTSRNFLTNKRFLKRFEIHRIQLRLIRANIQYRLFRSFTKKRPSSILQVLKIFKLTRNSVKSYRIMWKQLNILRLRITHLRLRLKLTRMFKCLFKEIVTIRISISSTAKLFLTHPKLITHTYIIYKKFPYYHNVVNFLDTVFTSTLALQFRDTQLLVSFICREIERTRQHFKFLSMLRQIVLYYHQGTSVIGQSGFRLLIRGPVNGHSRTKRIKFELQPAVQKSVFAKPLFYANFYSNTIFGTVGVRLWLG